MRHKGEGQSEREMRKQGDRVTARYREGQSARARDREREGWGEGERVCEKERKQERKICVKHVYYEC
jgi:hypothetical protein